MRDAGGWAASRLPGNAGRRRRSWPWWRRHARPRAQRRHGRELPLGRNVLAGMAASWRAQSDVTSLRCGRRRWQCVFPTSLMWQLEGGLARAGSGAIGRRSRRRAPAPPAGVTPNPLDFNPEGRGPVACPQPDPPPARRVRRLRIDRFRPQRALGPSHRAMPTVRLANDRSEPRPVRHRRMSAGRVSRALTGRWHQRGASAPGLRSAAGKGVAP